MPRAATATVATASSTATAKAMCQVKATISADTGRGSASGRGATGAKVDAAGGRGASSGPRAGAGGGRRAAARAVAGRRGGRWARRPRAGAAGLGRQARSRAPQAPARAGAPRAAARSRLLSTGSSGGPRAADRVRAPRRGLERAPRAAARGPAPAARRGRLGRLFQLFGRTPRRQGPHCRNHQPHRRRTLGGRRHPVDERIERLGQPQLVLDAAGAVAQVGAQPLAGGRGQLAVEAVADHPLGALAPAAAGERVARAAQGLAPAGQRGAHLLVAQAQLARRLAALHLAQLDERQGVYRLGVQVRQPSAARTSGRASDRPPGTGAKAAGGGGRAPRSEHTRGSRMAPRRSSANTYP